MLPRDFINKALILGVMLWIAPVFAQNSDPIRGPITALRQEGDVLLIGQQETLIEAQVTDTDLSVIRTLKLNRHDIRAFATSQNMILVLSEDGVTTLDSNGNALDFVQGGGQRIAVSGDRVYVAALNAGVRVLQLGADGKLEKLGVLKTVGPAADVAAEADGLAWVAEGDQGVRLYDTRNPSTPTVLIWLRDLAPATVVRVGGPRLYVGYGNHIAALDTLNLQSPKLLSSIALDSAQAAIGDLMVQGNHIYAGRIDKAGPDLVTVDMTDPKAMTAGSPFGESGAGERLALHGSDLFIGSGRLGLRRVHLTPDSPSLAATWEPLAVGVQACTASLPTDPQPINLSEAPHGPVTLTWIAACSPATYEIRVNGALVTTTHDLTYTFTPDQNAISWQVTAVDGSGHRVDGPLWHFDVADDGWLAGPSAPAHVSMVYAPPTIVVDSHSPLTVIAATCGALILGLLLVVGAAWFIGSRAENRTMHL